MRLGAGALALHQRYLKRLVERIGRLHLSQIAEDQPDGVPLEQVYIDGPTPLHISVEVRERKIVDWTIDKTIERQKTRIRVYTKTEPLRPADLGYEVAPLESLVGEIQLRIETECAEHPDWEWLWRDGLEDNVLTLNAPDIAAARDRLAELVRRQAQPDVKIGLKVPRMIRLKTAKKISIL